jgi:hypothetical protein
MEPDTMNKVDLDHSQGGRSVLVDIFAVVGVFGVSDVPTLPHKDSSFFPENDGGFTSFQVGKCLLEVSI